MRLFTIGFTFLLFSICQAVGQNPTLPATEKKKIETVLKDTIKKDLKKLDAKEQAKNEKFLKKLKKKLSFASNSKAKEQKRINAIIDKYIQDANLVSGIEIKKINDSLTKNRNIKIDSLGKVIDALTNDKDNLSKKVIKNFLKLNPKDRILASEVYFTLQYFSFIIIYSKNLLSYKIK
jgi:mRNA-degrading endonuclease RelE of RelBE toxin-antitoxin system